MRVVTWDDGRVATRGSIAVSGPLTGADLRGVTWAEAEYDKRTVFPERFDPQRHGLVLTRQ